MPLVIHSFMVIAVFGVGGEELFSLEPRSLDDGPRRVSRQGSLDSSSLVVIWDDSFFIIVQDI